MAQRDEYRGEGGNKNAPYAIGIQRLDIHRPWSPCMLIFSANHAGQLSNDNQNVTILRA
jgi:hypothetical protein